MGSTAILDGIGLGAALGPAQARVLVRTVPREHPRLADSLATDTPDCTHPFTRSQPDCTTGMDELLRYGRAMAVPCPCCNAGRWWPCRVTDPDETRAFHHTRETLVLEIIRTVVDEHVSVTHSGP